MELEEEERGTVIVATGMSSSVRSFLTTLPSPSVATLLLPCTVFMLAFIKKTTKV